MEATPIARGPMMASSQTAAKLEPRVVAGTGETVELLSSRSPSRADDVLAVVVAVLLAVGGIFISWVLFAPRALDVLK